MADPVSGGGNKTGGPSGVNGPNDAGRSENLSGPDKADIRSAADSADVKGEAGRLTGAGDDFETSGPKAGSAAPGTAAAYESPKALGLSDDHKFVGTMYHIRGEVDGKPFHYTGLDGATTGRTPVRKQSPRPQGPRQSGRQTGDPTLSGVRFADRKARARSTRGDGSRAHPTFYGGRDSSNTSTGSCPIRPPLNSSAAATPGKELGWFDAHDPHVGTPRTVDVDDLNLPQRKSLTPPDGGRGGPTDGGGPKGGGPGRLPNSGAMSFVATPGDLGSANTSLRTGGLMTGMADVSVRGLGVLDVWNGPQDIRRGIADFQNGDPAMGTLNTAHGTAQIASGAASVAGRVALGTATGGALAIVDGARDIYVGVSTGDTERTVVGAVKSSAGTAMVAGLATANPVLVVGGGAAYIGAVVYENREAIGNWISSWF